MLFSKAFDKLANCVQSWLGNRRQRAVVEGCFYDLETATSGVPYINMKYINNFDVNVEDMIKSADYMKVIGVLGGDGGCLRLQPEKDQLDNWAEDRQM